MELLLILLVIPVLVVIALLRRRRPKADAREQDQITGNEGSRKADI
ncbi:hypothetical protein [Nocardia wallacei]|nr:hypothetical protein [Nocardia wallacei]